MTAVRKDLYDPKTIDIDRLAALLANLSPAQLEALALRLDPEAMKLLEESARDLDVGATLPMNEW